MRKTLALLLDQKTNRYQQLLAQEARTGAARFDVALVGPEFAEGSSWTQLESINAQLRGSPPDAVVAMLAGSSLTKGPFERLLKAGVAVVLLNRIPEWMDELRDQHREAFAAAVSPDQVGIGRIQGEQALKLVKPGGFALLVTGMATSPAAAQRRRGFLDVVEKRLLVSELDGGWSVAGGERALNEWFRLGAERHRVPDLIVCHNDAMADGARTALVEQARSSGVAELERVRLTGCDGLAEEGRAQAIRGELAATVILPPTTPAAFEILRRYWDTGERRNSVMLEAASFPALDQIKVS